MRFNDWPDNVKITYQHADLYKETNRESEWWFLASVGDDKILEIEYCYWREKFVASLNTLDWELIKEKVCDTKEEAILAAHELLKEFL